MYVILEAPSMYKLNLYSITSHKSHVRELIKKHGLRRSDKWTHHDSDEVPFGKLIKVSQYVKVYSDEYTWPYVIVCKIHDIILIDKLHKAMDDALSDIRTFYSSTSDSGSDTGIFDSSTSSDSSDSSDDH